MGYILEQSWKEKLQNEFDQNFKIRLFSWLNNEYQTKTVFPPKEKVFSALNAVKLENIKVVIIGQDPYHVRGQADGMAFSCAQGHPQPSLQNIFKEIENCYGKKPATTGNLANWANQGVLLLNTTLTVREGEPNSHADCGWFLFTKKIIEIINNCNNPIVFMLWGSHAKQFLPLLTNPNHLVLTASHPSPLSVYSGFFGCKHFLKANEFLAKYNLTEIDWLR